MRIRFWLLLAIFCFGLALAQSPLRVGMKESAPFTMTNAQGEWEGISVQLWQAIAEDLGLSYTVEERDLPGLLAGIQDGSLDLVVGALTITEAREEVFDFTNSFFNTGLSVAVRKEKAGFLSILRGLFNQQLLQVVFILLLGLMLVSFLVWWFEKSHQGNPRQAHSVPHGIGWGVWWALITLIGYDDVQPRSFGGRVLAVVWMIASVVGVSVLTAVLTTVLTLDRLENRIQTEADLARVALASLEGSSSASYLERGRVVYQAYPSIAAGIEAVALGEVDAMVYDKPLLQYLIKENYPNKLEVLDLTFDPQNYAFALPSGSPLREDVNRSLLKVISQESWRDLLLDYLGN